MDPQLAEVTKRLQVKWLARPLLADLAADQKQFYAMYRQSMHLVDVPLSPLSLVSVYSSMCVCMHFGT